VSPHFTGAAEPLGRDPGSVVYLEAMQFGVRHRIGEFALSRMRYEIYPEVDPSGMVHHLTTEILAKSTGPRVYTDRQTASVELVRFASWRDHFKATYRGRWWMRWRSWNIRYTFRTDSATAEVKVEATIAVVFPHAGGLPEYLGRAYPVVWGERIS
jgi:hypothetical protein